MALPKQFKAARMTDATPGNQVDDHVGDLEDAICDVFGFTEDSDITESPFGCDNSGRLTKANIRQKAAAPVGWRFYDSTNSKEFRLVLNNTWIQIDENTGSEGTPTWTTRIKFALGTGLPQLASATDPSSANDLARKGYVDSVFGGSYFPAGTKLLFPQAAAPAGWTKDVVHDDKMIRVVTGSGGGTGGSWTISGISVQGHVLTLSEVPSHAHQYTKGILTAVAGTPGGYQALKDTELANTDSKGGDNAHTHGLTVGSAWRPAYVDCIIATKN